MDQCRHGGGGALKVDLWAHVRTKDIEWGILSERDVLVLFWFSNSTFYLFNGHWFYNEIKIHLLYQHSAYNNISTRSLEDNKHVCNMCNELIHKIWICTPFWPMSAQNPHPWVHPSPGGEFGLHVVVYSHVIPMCNSNHSIGINIEHTTFIHYHREARI